MNKMKSHLWVDISKTDLYKAFYCKDCNSYMVFGPDKKLSDISSYYNQAIIHEDCGIQIIKFVMNQ